MLVLVRPPRRDCLSSKWLASIYPEGERRTSRLRPLEPTTQASNLVLFTFVIAYGLCTYTQIQSKNILAVTDRIS